MVLNRLIPDLFFVRRIAVQKSHQVVRSAGRRDGRFHDLAIVDLLPV
jgi:hypothetical protein